MQFVFTDIEGSSRLWNEHRDTMPDTLRRHDALATALVDVCDGLVVKHTGDGVFAVFERGHALEFAVGFQRRITAESWDDVGGLHVRVGVAAGDPQRWAGDFFGPPVNRAARLAEAAWGDQVVVTAQSLAEDTCPAGTTVLDLGLHDFGDLGRPERVFQLRGSGLPEREFPPLRSGLVHPHGLPSETTPFVGRRSELGELLDIVRQPGFRLLTLAGPGGVGKTRLAIHLASSVERAYEWGVYFAQLAAHPGGAHLAERIGETLGFAFRAGLPPEDQLADYLADKDVLLILDNLEHMIEGLPLVARLLTECPRLKLMVTSRERLLLRGEHVYDVRGLAYPAQSHDDDFENYDAPLLFINACTRHDRSFALDLRDRDALLHVCRLTEGLPLALELAASWIRTMDVRAIADALESAPLKLTHRLRDIPERHRSLGAVIGYSYDLLVPDQQAALRALSVFRGGFTVEAAGEVCGVPLEMLASLVDKSLVRQTCHGRFDLHELTRRYAWELLGEEPEQQTHLTERLMRYYLRYVTERGPEGPATGSRGHMDRIKREIDNVRSAWHIALDRRDTPEVAASLDTLYRFLRVPGRDDEGAVLFSRAVSTFETVSSHAPDVQKTLAMLRIRLGHFQALACDYAEARRNLRRGLHAVRRLSAHDETALALQTLGRLWYMQGKLGRSQRAFDLSAAWWRHTKDMKSLALVLASLGHLSAARGDLVTARALHMEALALAPDDMVERVYAYLHCNLGLVELEMGDIDDAREALETAMRQSLAEGEPALISHIGNALAEVYMVSGDYGNAKALLEESMRIREQLGDTTYVVTTASRLSELANLEGASQRARQWATVGIEASQSLGHEELALECAVQAAWADLALDGPDAAQSRIRVALREAAMRRELKEQAKALAVVAMICRKRGNLARAVEILASISTAPPDYAVGQWVFGLLEQWRTGLPEDVGRVAEERGRTMDWRTIGDVGG